MAAVDWNELKLAEEPAARMLEFLGYRFVEAAVLDAERASPSEGFVRGRLAAALRRLNPWIDDGNVEQAIGAVSAPADGGLVEANEAIHTLLVHGLSLPQDLGHGRLGQQVRFVDFDDVDRNEWVFTRQWRVKGVEATAVPDLVVFVNGLPLGIVECKSPTVQRPVGRAIEQLRRYQELDEGHRHRGAPRLFFAAQVLVAAAGEAAKFGTVGTPPGFWGYWKVPFPESIDALTTAWGAVPRAQEVLLYGLFCKPNLLSLVRDFVVFEAAGGRMVRKVARCPQFVAVHRALERVRTAQRSDLRGGVVWHTQGSGKSLTMLFLAVALRREPGLGNPTLVVVTDRRDLDRQIAETFRRCGFPNPVRAKSVEHLRAVLGKGGGGRTVLTTVQKFQTRGGEAHPVLDASRDVFVMVDEAHRTQYRSLAMNMRAALPHACFFGFTGTPIDRRDRSTFATFGGYIHTYTIEQAVHDEATVPIFYEMRLVEERVEGQNLDALFERYFKDLSEENRGRLRVKYATPAAIAGAPRRVEAVCLDLIDHFERHIAPNGFKAQVVAPSREAAVTYAETLARLGGPPAAVIMSSGPQDEARLVAHRTSAAEQRRLIERFKDRDDPLAMLVVCDMLLTGFDAPVEQVLYLDASLREHTLLQAVARVNRTAPGKDFGLVVDYWGVAAQLEEALAIFDPAEVRGAMRPRAAELPTLQSAHRRVLRFFSGVDRDDLEACLAVIEPEDVRAEFEAAFRRFARALDMLLPAPMAQPFVADARWLGKLRAVGRARFYDERLDLSACRAKVRQLIDAHISAGAARVLVEPVSVLAPGFDESLAALESDTARASAMEHAVRHEISVRMAANPAFYEKLSARLTRIIEDRRAERIEMAEQLELLEGVVLDLRGLGRTADAMGLDEPGFAVFGVLGELAEAAAGPAEVEARRTLAAAIVDDLRPLAVVDWLRKDDVQRRMRLAIKERLRAAGVPRARVESATLRLLEVARQQLGR